MAKIVTCPNGHKYDYSIYGDKCPFCPSSDDSGKTQMVAPGSFGDEGHTMLNNPTGATSATSAATVISSPVEDSDEGHTCIHVAGGESAKTGRMVALLVSYDTNPCGEVYKIVEGRTLIGRAITGNNISVPTDKDMSSTHLLLLYVAAEGIFWAEDQKSSNGTFINDKFARGLTELHTNDKIRIGNTTFTFLAIPQ